MAAVTRWVLYSTTEAGVISTGGATVSGLGTRGYIQANSTVGNSFNIGASNNKLFINLDGDVDADITLASGTDLDPRFVARDITEKIHALPMIEGSGYTNAQCVFTNDQNKNKLRLYSGTLGVSSSATVLSGANTAHIELGFGAPGPQGGFGTGNTSNRGITVSGTYNGFFDETYRIVIMEENAGANIGVAVPDGGTSFGGTVTMGGVFNHGVDLTYTISIDTAGGHLAGGGTGFVPTMAWTSTGSVDDSVNPIELLYNDYWYQLGTKGVMIKFSAYEFNNWSPAWTVACKYPHYAEGGNVDAGPGVAKYIWGSTRGDDSDAALTTRDDSYTELGSRGVYFKFTGGNNLKAGDEYYVVCKPPQPLTRGISNLNYGNVTVSTASPVKAVMFEIMGGTVVEMSTVKFGLQSHGTFAYHDIGSPTPTQFHFGTVGPGNNPVSPAGAEWRTNVSAANISSDTPENFLYATKEDLPVVVDADNSESIGVSHYMGMVADPIFLAIKLGASEVGANSTINYRLYFDYS